MSDFEEIACKGLGIVLFLLVVILSVQLMGCATGGTTIGWTDSGAPIVKPKGSTQAYPLLDNRGILHTYRDNFDKIVFPTHNKKLTLYCGSHFQWENVTAMWKSSGGNIGHREEADYYRWMYIVSKHPKN